MRIVRLLDSILFLMFLILALWWSGFCFSKGYALGKHGTENKLADWAIGLVMGFGQDAEDDSSIEPAQ